MTQSNPSSDAFNDSLNFVKKLWGQMSVPGMSAPGTSPTGMPGLQGFPTMALPSMSLEDLDKRIQELKTVETWLNVNMTMLRNTIQALEVQRGTIATLHSLSSTMAHTMQSMGGGEGINPFSAGLGAARKSDSEPEVEVEAGAASDESAEEVSPLIAQSAAWWQGVQEQFKQALGTALEKSTANYDAAKFAAENITRGITPAAPKKAAAAKATPKAGSKTKAGATTAAKSRARTTRKPASKTASKSPARKTGSRV